MKNLEEMKDLLIIIDMVKGFVSNGKNLGDPSVGHILEEQLRLINYFLKRKEGIMFVKDTHKENSIELKNFPEHCLKGSVECELEDVLMPYEKDAIVIEKNSFCAVFAPNFLETINNMPNLQRIVGVGCESDICVLNTMLALKSYLNEINRAIRLVVPTNAIETFGPQTRKNIYNNAAIKMMETSGIEVVRKLER